MGVRGETSSRSPSRWLGSSDDADLLPSLPNGGGSADRRRPVSKRPPGRPHVARPGIAASVGSPDEQDRIGIRRHTTATPASDASGSSTVADRRWARRSASWRWSGLSGSRSLRRGSRRPEGGPSLEKSVGRRTAGAGGKREPSLDFGALATGAFDHGLTPDQKLEVRDRSRRSGIRRSAWWTYGRSEQVVDSCQLC